MGRDILGTLCVHDDICLRVSAVGGDQRELLLSEGTVILHITFALKQDQVWNITPDPRNT